jgi:putative ABC transport system permease protein
VKASMYLKYPSRSLVRGGQRTLLAMFCVAVGVMAIVALQLVGLMINNAFTSNIRDANGGDIAVRSTNEPFKQSDFAFFDQLKRDGTIQNYTAAVNVQAYTGKISLRETLTVRAVDPAVYPLVTPPTFNNPKDGKIADLLKGNQAIVTQPFVDQHNTNIGDVLDIHIGSETQATRIIQVQIVGIVSTTGILAQEGSVLLLSIDYYKATMPQGPPTAQPGQSSSTGAGTNPVNTTEQNAVLYDTVNVTADPQKINGAKTKIQQQFRIANVQTADDALQQTKTQVDNVRQFLEIAGLLALLIGGVGIVNTMQVLLSRRKTEIAMLKTTGYRRFDLYLLFGMEAGLLGLIGGLVGAGAATGVSYLVRNLVQQTFNLNIPFLLDWFTIGGGVIIGLATALIFGLLPIVQAANIRPLNVIRDLPEGRGARSFLLTLFLLLILSVLFCVLAIVLLNNNVALGIYSVYGAFIFLGILSLFFSLVVLLISKLPVLERFNLVYLTLILLIIALSAWLLFSVKSSVFGGLLLVFALVGFIVVVLPRTWKANVKMALRNIGRQRARTTTTMLALFVGIFTIGLILALGQDLRDQINSFIEKTFNYNVYVFTANGDTTTLHNKLHTLPGLTASQEHVLVGTSPVSINDKPIADLLPTGHGGPNSLGRNGTLYFLSGIEGYDVANKQLPATDTAKITKGRNLQAEDADTDNVVISSLLANLDPLHLKIGDKIALTNAGRSVTRIVNVVGVYESSGFTSTAEPIWGTKSTVTALSPVGLSQSIFYLKIDSNQLSKTTDLIGQAVPTAFVFNLSNITDVIDQFLKDALITLTTIASLSLLAGVIIIANAVALAMLERRRELGILKSVGYTSRSILSEVLLENAVVAGAGALLAMLLATIAISLLGTLVFKSDFGVSPLISLGLILGSALLAMIVSALVAWGAVRVRPLEVLRYE